MNEERHLKVVGFVGRPEPAGAGIRTPLLKREDGLFEVGSADGAGSSVSVFDELELDDLCERGMMTRTAKPLSETIVEDGVVIYVTRDFWDPGAHASPLGEKPPFLIDDESTKSYLAYRSRDDALKCFHDRGRFLVIKALAYLRVDPARAYQDASRAAYLFSTKEKDQFIETFALIAAAREFQSKDSRLTYAEAALALRDQAAVDEIRSIARTLQIVRDSNSRPASSPGDGRASIPGLRVRG
jgi:hypothetical protein